MIYPDNYINNPLNGNLFKEEVGKNNSPITPEEFVEIAIKFVRERQLGKNVPIPTCLPKGFIDSIHGESKIFLDATLEHFKAETEEDRVAFALIFALEENKPEVLSEIVTTYFKKGSDKFFSDFIIKFNVKDPKALGAIAKITAEKYPIWTSKNIKKFGFKDEQILIEIGKIAVKNPKFNFQKYKEYYGIQNPAAISEINVISAKANAEGSFSWSLESLDQFEIEDPQVLVEILEIVARRDDVDMSKQIHEYIKKYKISDEEALFKIARIHFDKMDQDEEYTTSLSKYIQNYGIKDQKKLIQIAEIALEKDKEFCKYIQNFGLTGQEDLARLAQAYSKNHDISDVIQNFGLTDEKTLLEILKDQVEKYPQSVAYNIKNYQITEQQELIKVAWTVLKSDIRLSQYIQYFNITDQKALEGLLQSSFEKEGSKIIPNIVNFKVTNKKFLFEIAKKLLENTTMFGFGNISCSLSEHIHSLGLTDQNDLITLAKLASKRESLTLYIKNYGITIEKALIEIAFDQVENHCSHFSITNYGIKDQKALFAIAMTIAKNRYYSVSSSIDLYGITDEAALDEIAKTEAAKNGVLLLQNLNKYTIKSQKRLVEIIKVALLSIDPSIDEYLKVRLRDCPLKESDRLSIFFHQFKKNSKTDISLFNVNEAYVDLWRSEPQDILDNTARIVSDKNKKSFIHLIGNLIKKIEEKPSPFVKEQLYNWLKYTITCSLHSDNTKDIPLKAWETVLSYRDPKVRLELSDLFAQIKDSDVDTYEDIINQKNEDFILVPALILARLIKNQDKWKGLLPKLQDRFFRDYVTLKPLVNTLLALNRSQELSEDDIISLLSKTINIQDKKKTLFNLYSIEGILNLQGASLLTKEAFEKNDDFSKIYQQVFQKEIPIQGIDNFSKKFAETFATYRSNEALLLYAGKLKWHSNNEEALGSLAAYVGSVLNGKFKEERYLDSEHLSLVFKDRGESKKAWMAGASEKVDIAKKQNDLSETSQIDYPTLIKNFIVKDNHLDSSQYPYIHKYLSGTEAERTGFQNELNREVEKTKGRIQDSETIKQEARKYEGLLQKLNVEQSIMNFVKSQRSENREQTLGKVHKVLSSDPKKIEEAILNVQLPPSMITALKHQTTEDKIALFKKLTQFFDPNTATTERQEMEKKFNEEIGKNKEGVEFFQQQKAVFEQQKLLLKKLELQESIVSLLKSKSREERLNSLTKASVLLRIADKDSKFNADIHNLIKSSAVKEGKTIEDQFTLVDTDDPWDLLISGTEVEGSCQHVSGDPSLNVGLLGLALDGKHRLIAIKDATGKIVARRILRILWDADKNQPILLAEKIYGKSLSNELVTTLNAFVKKRAAALGFALYEEGSKDDIAVNFESKSCRSPLGEYVDSAGGIQSTGIYTIKTAKLMQTVAS